MNKLCVFLLFGAIGLFVALLLSWIGTLDRFLFIGAMAFLIAGAIGLLAGDLDEDDNGLA